MNNYPQYAEVKGKKYKINTDFRVAIECNRIAENNNIGDFERVLGIIATLYGNEAIDDGKKDFEIYEKLLKIAKIYLSCGKELNNNSKEEIDMDFIEDYGYIWASFMSDYNGMDIDKINMHWWKFNELMNGLSNSDMGNCCVLNRVRNLRNCDTSKIKDQKEKQKIIKAKQQVALKKNKKKKQVTEKQKESARKFIEALGLKGSD